MSHNGTFVKLKRQIGVIKTPLFYLMKNNTISAQYTEPSKEAHDDPNNDDTLEPHQQEYYARAKHGKQSMVM